ERRNFCVPFLSSVNGRPFRSVIYLSKRKDNKMMSHTYRHMHRHMHTHTHTHTHTHMYTHIFVGFKNFTEKKKKEKKKSENKKKLNEKDKRRQVILGFFQ
ncbi:hypothetical protein LOAG_11843, partial [Loa loa]